MRFLPQTAGAVRTLFVAIAAVAGFTLAQPDDTLHTLVGEAIPVTRFVLGALLVALAAVDPSIVAQRARDAAGG